MIRAALVAGLLLVPLVPSAGVAQDMVRTETRYTPDPLWYYGRPANFIGAAGRVRIVSGGGVSVALDLNQYWDYENAYREALGRHAMRMTVMRADQLARRDAIAAVFARYPERQVAAFRTDPVARPLPPPIRPTR